ncbi:P-loop containing nucleoside triphosphate hydrolase protein [Rhypophila sp. PSN 637]
MAGHLGNRATLQFIARFSPGHRLAHIKVWLGCTFFLSGYLFFEDPRTGERRNLRAKISSPTHSAQITRTPLLSFFSQRVCLDSVTSPPALFRQVYNTPGIFLSVIFTSSLSQGSIIILISPLWKNVYSHGSPIDSSLDISPLPKRTEGSTFACSRDFQSNSGGKPSSKGRGRENGRGRGGKKQNGSGRLTKSKLPSLATKRRHFITREEIEGHIKKTFQSIEEFADVHKQATDVEFVSQTKPIREHNESETSFHAWVMAAPPEDAQNLGFIFRVEITSRDEIANLLPNIGDMCEVAIEHGSEWSALFYAERTSDLIPVHAELVEYPEFKVLNIDPKWAEVLRKKIPGNPNLNKLQHGDPNHVNIRIQLHLSYTTYNAETKALSHIQRGASCFQRRAFELLVLLSEPKSATDLSMVYPYMVDSEKISCEKLKSKLPKMYGDLDDDQRHAYRKLGNIPEGVFLLPGVAGSGKTRWCLSVAALAQAGDSIAKALYLLDVNKSLDDAASKWSSECLSGRRRLRRVWRMSQNGARMTNTALRLDEAACQFFRTSAHLDEFEKIRRFLDIGNISPRDWGDQHRLVFKESRELIEEIYRQVLKEADFIAATPVAAFCHFGGMFEPDLVFFDEAAHARELSTLIAISFFSPHAWFFVGDWHQTSPYVGHSDRTNVITHRLLTNHRSLGGLHRLPSNLFYDGSMNSKQQDDCIPHSLTYLRDFFLKFRGTATPPSPREISDGMSKAYPVSTVPRFVVDLESRPKHALKSFWNIKNHNWVMSRVSELLDDPMFLQTDCSTPETILILSLFGDSFQKYRSALDKTFDTTKRLRVEARTLGTAQGVEADVVFIDMVKDKPSPFSNDKKCLCVALTRARQAEVIMMGRGMAGLDLRARDRFQFDHDNLQAIYNGCLGGEHGTLLRALWLVKHLKKSEDDVKLPTPIEKAEGGIISQEDPAI